MKKTLSFLLAVTCLAACKKKENVVNNYYTQGSPQPAFIVNGISDMTFINDANYGSALTLTIEYADSAQQNVTLAVNGLPAGIDMDNTWISSGIPTFATTLTLFDTNAVGVTPGIYPVSLTATTASGKVKTYPFNLRVSAMPTGFTGKYNSCTTNCGGTNLYTDSVYLDAAVPNKVWFTNFANTGVRIYALVSNPEIMTVPPQSIGGITYSGSANLSLATHHITMSIRKNTTSCTFNML